MASTTMSVGQEYDWVHGRSPIRYQRLYSFDTTNGDYFDREYHDVGWYLCKGDTIALDVWWNQFNYGDSGGGGFSTTASVSRIFRGRPIARTWQIQNGFDTGFVSAECYITLMSDRNLISNGCFSLADGRSLFSFSRYQNTGNDSSMILYRSTAEYDRTYSDNGTSTTDTLVCIVHDSITSAVIIMSDISESMEFCPDMKIISQKGRSNGRVARVLKLAFGIDSGKTIQIPFKNNEFDIERARVSEGFHIKKILMRR